MNCSLHRHDVYEVGMACRSRVRIQLTHSQWYQGDSKAIQVTEIRLAQYM